MITGSMTYHFGDCSQDGESRSLKWEANISACRALRRSASRSTPGGVPRASFRRRGASFRKALIEGIGSHLHALFLSMGGRRGRDHVLITDKSHEPGGDESLLGERIRTEKVTLEMGDSN